MTATKTPSGSYRYVRISPDMYPLLKSLFELVFKKKITLREFINKYHTAPIAGIDAIGYLALDEQNNPAAYYGVFPCLYFSKGKTVLIAQSGDTMTHPSHQGKGLFVYLAQLTYQTAMAEGVQFVFGIPNKNSFHGFSTKLDWEFKESICSYTIRLKTIPLARFCLRSHLLVKLYKYFFRLVFDKSNQPDRGFKQPDQSLFLSPEMIRYKRNSGMCCNKGEDSYVFFKYEGFVWIGLIAPCNEQSLSKLISRYSLRFRLMGITELRFIGSKKAMNFLNKDYGTFKKESTSLGFFNPLRLDYPANFLLHGFESDTF
jgi:hypothetical protein